MNREKLLEEITKTKEYLANVEKMLEECKYERWKPKVNEKFWYIDSFGFVNYSLFMSETESRFKNYNCFQTKEEAEQETEKILIRRQLEDIAKRLNKNNKIDWENRTQNKYLIYFNYGDEEIGTYSTMLLYKEQGAIYCLDKNFKDIAIEEIGEERLKRYLRGK